MKNLDLELLIPHRHPALIVTAIEKHGPKSLKAIGRIDEEHPLADEGSVPSVLAIEFAAQSAGLLLGVLRQTEDPESVPPQIGYLASLRDIRLQMPLLSVNRPLTAEVTLEGRLGSMALFSATVKVEEEIAATGRFTIAGKKDN